MAVELGFAGAGTVLGCSVVAGSAVRGEAAAMLSGASAPVGSMCRASGLESVGGEVVRFLNWKRDLGASEAVTVLSWSVRDLMVCFGC